MAVLPHDYYPVGAKVRFLHERDANIWRVTDCCGVIKSSRAFNAKEKMLIVHFGPTVVTAASTCFRIVNE